ncbi:hypothetical protein M3P05_11515 [Sansalvadorimonas sp. 2012CJ34-2]|uniref:Fido domain-containing protein n=1 Tax=Parendozoicomonas callyspongiae TaxID=2942213 RepID=A0ABT0PHS2_9GAMM|nr:hypothetical protein [Sansalvadorimonas sp. 2012CJ34-2]MCL6270551.1 hypothetical protein [Sansalvadorimonas sp. 2012CJ34-2]
MRRVNHSPPHGPNAASYEMPNGDSHVAKSIAHALAKDIENDLVFFKVKSLDDSKYKNDAVRKSIRQEILIGMADKFCKVIKSQSLDGVKTIPGELRKILEEKKFEFFEPRHAEWFLEGIVLEHEAATSLSQTLRQYPNLPQKFTANDAWRLIIDGARQTGNFSPYCFDYDECGYIQGATFALEYALSINPAKIDHEVIYNVHEIATRNTMDATGFLASPLYRTGLMYFVGHMKKNVSPEGEKELVEKTQTSGSLLFGWLAVEKAATEHLFFRYVKGDPQQAVIRLEMATAAYHATMAVADTEDKKLSCIATLAKDIDQLHVFNDANLRTAYIIANSLLINHGLSPMIMDYPDVIDGHTTPELVELFKKGQLVFRRLFSD